MAWMVQINGFIVDARHLKRDIQEEALRMGLIPYIPTKTDRLEDSDDDLELGYETS